MIINDSGSNTTTQIRPEFRFSNTSHAGMFNESYRKRVANDGTFTDINAKSSAEGILDYQDRYYSQGQIPQIVPNEDYNTTNDVAGFFPGIAWLDAYNKNTNENIVSLQSELTDTTPTYFTRDKIKFKNAGGKAQTSLSQTIDLSDIADMIDGNAYGITHATSQFFAYVGAGITNYKIRLSTPDGIVEFPYYIGTSEEYAEMFASNFRDGVSDSNEAFVISGSFYDEVQQKWLSYSEAKASLPDITMLPYTKIDEQVLSIFRTNVRDILNELNKRRDYYERSENINDILIEAANNLPNDGWDWWRGIKISFNNLRSLLDTKNIPPSTEILRLQRNLNQTGIQAPLGINSFTDEYTSFSYTPTTSDLDFYYGNQRRKRFTYDSDELKRLVTRNLYNFLKDTIAEIETNVLPSINSSLINVTNDLKKARFVWDVERTAAYVAQEARKRKINAYSDIEIIPVLDDQTKIQINYLDSEGITIKTDTINGPDEQTVWAVKEKVYFPLTLYPLFEFVKPNENNTIKVFDQKYTDTFTLGAFFNLLNVGKGEGPLSKGTGSLQEGNKITSSSIGLDTYFSDLGQAYFYGYDGANDQIRDVNAKFLMNKYDFKTYGGAYPPDNGNINPQGGVYAQNSYKAVYDFGAAAMFGVELTAAIPKKTRSVQITVFFDHKSAIIDDNSPQTKGWTSSEIYSDEYGQSTGYSSRLVEYGNPRCGITSMKYLVAANNFEKSPKYPSYYLPPASATVLGLQKEKYLNPSAFNSADAPEFSYNLIFPTELPEL
jgi:hypothetical protein